MPSLPPDQSGGPTPEPALPRVGPGIQGEPQYPMQVAAVPLTLPSVNFYGGLLTDRASNSPTQRIWAAQRLGESGRVETLPFLNIAAQTDPNPRVRAEAVASLAHLGYPFSIGVLLSRLSDNAEITPILREGEQTLPSTTIAIFAAQQLVQFKSHLDLFSKQLGLALQRTSNGPVAVALCNALAWTKPSQHPANSQLLVRVATHSSDPELRRAAVLTLEAQYGTGVVDIFSRIIGERWHWPSTRHAAIQALGTVQHLDSKAIALNHLSRIVFQAPQGEKLGWLFGNHAVEYAVSAVKALGTLKHPRANQLLLDTLATELKALGDAATAEVTEVAATNHSIRSVLIRALRDSPRGAHMIPRALEILGALGEEHAIPNILFLIDSPLPSATYEECQEKAVQSLFALRYKLTSDHLRGLSDLAHSVKSPVQLCALRVFIALGEFGATECGSVISVLDHATNHSTIEAAIAALSAMKNASALPALQRLNERMNLPRHIHNSASAALNSISAHNGIDPQA